MSKPTVINKKLKEVKPAHPYVNVPRDELIHELVAVEYNEVRPVSVYKDLLYRVRMWAAIEKPEMTIREVTEIIRVVWELNDSILQSLPEPMGDS